MKTVATNIKLRVLLTDIRDGKLIPRPEFQRRLVWADKHKNAFIQTVLMGFPFPEIYVAAGDVDLETGEGSQMLVDGQQRISSLNDYFIGSPDLKLARDISPYNKLSKDQKTNFLEYDVVARDLGALPIDTIKQVFERINSTRYALNAMEIHNARYDGEFKKFAEDLADDEFFERHRTFSTQDVRRMSDLVYILTLVITFMSNYFNRDDDIERYLKQYNDEFEQRDTLYKEFKDLLAFVERCDFVPNSRVWKKADLFTLLVELHRILFQRNKSLEPKTVGRALQNFYSQVDSAEAKADADDEATFGSYKKDTLQGTNDRSSRVRRGVAIARVLNSL